MSSKIPDEASSIDYIEHLRAKLSEKDRELEDHRREFAEIERESERSSRSVDQQDRRNALWVRIAIIAMAGVTLIAAFVLLDRKLPDRANRFLVPDAVTTTGKSMEPAPAVLLPTGPSPSNGLYSQRAGAQENERALVFSAIEAYAQRSDNAGRATIPGEELAKRVIEPLTKAGLIAEETSKALLLSAMDGGKTLVTDYFHQKWQDQFRGKDTKRNGGSTPTVVCSPVFNAAPQPLARVRQRRAPVIRRPAALKSVTAPTCQAPNRS